MASGPIKVKNAVPKKKREIAYMVKGLMAQLIKSVRPTGFTFFPALSTSPKSILTMMGYIIKKRQTAIGIETTGASPT